MDTRKKRQARKSIGFLLRWLMLSLLFVGTHALAQTGGTVTYVYTDPQGTPLAETDASGNITATFEYTPYGTYAPQGTSAPGAVPRGPGYTGHVNDPETNLVYMQARYYDPVVGRFLSVDPILVNGANLFAFGRYIYADNNPVLKIDPDGKQSTFDAGYWAGTAVMAQQGQEQVKRLNEMNETQLFVSQAATALDGAAELVSLGRAIIVKAGLESSVDLSPEAIRGIRSLQKRIEEHVAKLEEFKNNPTVRPGMEKLPKEVIEKQQARRIAHLEKEIKTFKENIQKLKNPPPPPPPTQTSAPSPTPQPKS
jgi:RHS repeat-associated protein